MHIHTYTYVKKNIHTHYIHPCIYIYTHTLYIYFTHMYIYIYTHTLYIYIYVYTYIYMCILMYTHTHRHTDTHTDTHTYKYTHRYTQIDHTNTISQKDLCRDTPKSAYNLQTHPDTKSTNIAHSLPPQPPSHYPPPPQQLQQNVTVRYALAATQYSGSLRVCHGIASSGCDYLRMCV